MSNLASFSVINQKVEKIFTEESTANKGTAFTYLCLRTLFKLTDEELEETITDGSMDGEIDAIYISDRTIHLLTFKYTDRFELSQKNYPGTDLDQFILTTDLIISGNLDEQTINGAVWEKYQEIRNLASSGKIEFKIHVISNKLHPVDSSKLKLKNAVEKYRIVDEPIYLDQEDLVTIILADKSKQIDGQIRFIDKQHFEKSDGNIKSIIGSVAATDLIDLIKLNDKEINEEAFNENVRVYKPKHRVNKAIIESASDENNFQFFYLNNGITILCENVDYAPNTRSPLAELKNFQIINGGQTSHSLFEVYKASPDKLNSIELLVRICEAKKDNPLSDKISETSNNQIPVGSRDLHSNDLIQRKLEEEFVTLGLHYERKPNQHSDEPKDKVYNNEILGQLFMAYHLELASEAKNSKSKVFADLYDQIFDEMIINASELIRLHKLYKPLLEQKKEIQKKKRKKEVVPEKEAFVSRAIFHIVSGTKHLFERAFFEIDQQDISQSDKIKEKDRIHSEKGSEFTNEVIDIIYEVVSEEILLRPDLYTHDKFFKEIPTNSIIRNKILEKINAGNKEYSA
ncbi:AIPR family protein [Cellulophaga sp. F20128]|uniref:AIPR family protein n=1 Tax=Cellulophaga sp. F20128 TaxID=2926413 RepID=UPI001FF23E51|nr:AIPR family protein [Cellulophaga sp. F20128]MCK0158856.1 AIPR family protein [Cellulophaga sp. F20128]